MLNFGKSESDFPFYELVYESKKVKSMNKNEIMMLRLFENCKLKYLIENGINIERYSTSYGANAIHLAALFGRNDIILWLYIKNNSTIHSVDMYGYSALEYSMANHQLSSVLLLSILGLDVKSTFQTKPFLNYYIERSANLKKINYKLIRYFVSSVFLYSSIRNQLSAEIDKHKTNYWIF